MGFLTLFLIAVSIRSLCSAVESPAPYDFASIGSSSSALKDIVDAITDEKFKSACLARLESRRSSRRPVLTPEIKKRIFERCKRMLEMNGNWERLLTIPKKGQGILRRKKKADGIAKKLVKEEPLRMREEGLALRRKFITMIIPDLYLAATYELGSQPLLKGADFMKALVVIRGKLIEGQILCEDEFKVWKGVQILLYRVGSDACRSFMSKSGKPAICCRVKVSIEEFGFCSYKVLTTLIIPEPLHTNCMGSQLHTQARIIIYDPKHNPLPREFVRFNSRSLKQSTNQMKCLYSAIYKRMSTHPFVKMQTLNSTDSESRNMKQKVKIFPKYRRFRLQNQGDSNSILFKVPGQELSEVQISSRLLIQLAAARILKITIGPDTSAVVR